MILFVCAQAQLRSRTAELLCLFGGVDARCCGTDASALVPATDAMLRCAHAIFCMENEQLDLVKKFMRFDKNIAHVLDIEDKYDRLDPSLCLQLIQRVSLVQPGLGSAMTRGWNHLRENSKLLQGLR